MSKYLKLFETTSEYEEYINGGEVVLPNVSFCEDEKGVHYKPWAPHDYSQDYFTTVATTGGNITWSGTEDNALSYSTDDGENWSDEGVNITLSVNEGDKVLWKGITTPYPQQYKGIGKFSGDTDVRYSVEGNVMSLLFGDNFKGQTSLEGKSYAFWCLFNSNINVTSAENLSLPATALADSCYANMFYGCTSLTTAPELPATTLANYCYSGMFYGCTSLTTAPSELPVTTLAEGCYTTMFYDCTSLTTAPKLPATTLAVRCYGNMFNGCTSLTTAPELPATTLVQGCYSSMFYWCSSLTTAPELPATTLAEECYDNMFRVCQSLSSIKCLATNKSASNCTRAWLDGVAASGTFTKAASMTGWPRNTSGIPSGWTVQDA